METCPRSTKGCTSSATSGGWRIGSNVCITGGNGYLGSVLQNLLKGARIIDKPNDIRQMSGIEEKTVIHLAALRDVECNADPEQAWSVNAEGTKTVVEAAERSGTERFVMASSCSIYGWREGLVDEESPVEPTSTYGRTKAVAEDFVRRSSIPSKVILRFATMFGASPNMRWDTMFNQFVKDAKKGRIEVYEPQAWRPLLHVSDAARAIVKAASIEGDLTLNVGYRNYLKGGLAEMVAKNLGARVETVGSVKDRRSYRVSFDRMAKFLPVPKLSPGSSVWEVAESI